MQRKEEKMKKVQAEGTTEQIDAVCEALDSYSRLCIGQLENVADLVRQGIIPMAAPNGDGDRQMASIEIADRIHELMLEAKALLGYSRNGSHGIGHRHVHVTGCRAYEMKKVLDKVIAEDRNPCPVFRNVRYDGLGPRYTQDPAPEAKILDED
jgi:hypothetical protein